MGSSCDDGMKNADVVDGLDGALSGYGGAYEHLDRYETGQPYRGSRFTSSQALIERTVEASVLTTLLRRHGTLRQPAQGLAGQQRGEPSAADFEQFLVRLSEGDCPAALALLTPWRHPFGLLDDQLADLLAAAAQRLGKAWEEDRLSFAEVSLGLVTLQRLLHEFAPPSRVAPVAERRMLLAPIPGEVHSFGLRMLGIRFQQAGWNCQCESIATEEALLARIATGRWDVFGLSVQDEVGGARAADLIKRVRQASASPNLRILLGGAPFAGNPRKALDLGADLPALPFGELYEALERLVSTAGS